MPAINQIFYFSAVHQTVGIEIPRYNLVQARIFETVMGIIPTLQLTLKDPGNLTEIIPLMDQDVISISFANNYLDSSVDTVDFYVSDFRIVPVFESKTSNIIISGYLKTESMFFPSLTRAFRGTSAEVLKKLAKECGLDIGTIDPTNDNMVWYQNTCNYNFIKHIITRGYIPNSAVVGFMDMFGKFNYMDLNKALQSSVKFNAHYNLEMAQALGLSPSNQASQIYFESYDLLSLNGQTKRDTGYGVDIWTYDGRKSKHDYAINKFTNTDLYNRSSKYNSSDKISLGFVSPEHDVFDGYPNSVIENCVRLRDFTSTSLVLKINALSQVRMMDKVDLAFPSYIEGGKSINDAYSGNYNITAITHQFDVGDVYKKYTVICRSGANKSSVRTTYPNLK